MATETVNSSNYFYIGLKKIIDSEAAYVDAKQQSAKLNLPKRSLNILNNISFAVKGITAAVALGYGAPLSVTALATLSLFPSNIFSCLDNKSKASISGLSSKMYEWWYYGEKNYNDNEQLNSTTTPNNSYFGDIKNWISNLETAQYFITNGLVLYYNLLPVNWLKIIVVEAVEQSLSLYCGGTLPEYYTKHALGDWIWVLTEITGEVIQCNKLLKNSSVVAQPLSVNATYFTENCLSTINWSDNYDLITQQNTNLIKYLSIINTQYAVSIIPIIACSLTGKLKNKFNSMPLVGFSMSIIPKVSAGSTVINLQSGTSISTVINLTQLSKTTEISYIKYPQQLAAIGLKFYPQSIEAYISGQIIKNNQLLATNRMAVELLSLGIQLPTETLRTTFLINGLLKWQYHINNLPNYYSPSSPVIDNKNGIIYFSWANSLYAIYLNGSLAWQYQISSSPYFPFLSPVVGNDGTVYATSSFGGYLYAIYPNGILKWQYVNPSGNPFTTVPAVVDDGTIYVGCCLNDGSVGGCSVCAFYSYGTLKWQYQTGATNAITIGTDGTVYAGSNGFLYAISNSGNLVWKFSSIDDRYGYGSKIFIAVANDNTVYVASSYYGDYLYAIYDGTLKWQYQIDSIFISDPVIANDGTVYIEVMDHNYNYFLYSIYPNGNLKWQYQTGNTSSTNIFLTVAISGDDTIYTGCNYGICVVYFNGILKWQYVNSDGISSNLAITSGTFYVTNSQALYAVSTTVFIDQSIWPQIQQNNLHSGTQTNVSQLQIFNSNYLTFDGIPTITGSLSLECFLDPNQLHFLVINITLIQNFNFQLNVPIIFNLQQGVPINILFNLTQIPNISNLIIHYIQELEQSNLQLYPILINNYTSNQTLKNYQLLATNINQTNLLSIGIQEPKETLKTTFLIDGQLKWLYQFNDNLLSCSSPIVDGAGIVYALSGYSVYAINPNSKLKWQYFLGGNVGSSAAIDNHGTIYIGNQGSSSLYAIHNDGTLKWRFTITIAANPAVANDGTVYICGGYPQQYLYSININGNLNWAYEISAFCSTPVIANNGEVYVGASNGYLYAIYSNGILAWLYKTSVSSVSSPAIEKDGTIYAASGYPDTDLYAIYPNGTLKWKYQIFIGNAGISLSSPSVSTDGTIYVGYDQLYAIYPNGSLRWKYQVNNDSSFLLWWHSSSPIITNPVISIDGTIYIGAFGDVLANPYSYNFYLHAIYPNGNVKWKYKTGASIKSGTNTLVSQSIPEPVIASDGTIYLESMYNYGVNLYAIGSKIFSDSSIWSQFQQNSLHGAQQQTKQLQIFDARCLILTGIPIVTGSLSLRITLNSDQSYYLIINGTLVNVKPTTITETQSSTFSSSFSPTPTDSITMTKTSTSINTQTATNSDTITETSTTTYTDTLSKANNKVLTTTDTILSSAAALPSPSPAVALPSLTFTPTFTKTNSISNTNSVTSTSDITKTLTATITDTSSTTITKNYIKKSLKTPSSTISVTPTLSNNVNYNTVSPADSFNPKIVIIAVCTSVPAAVISLLGFIWYKKKKSKTKIGIRGEGRNSPSGERSLLEDSNRINYSFSEETELLSSSRLLLGIPQQSNFLHKAVNKRPAGNPSIIIEPIVPLPAPGISTIFYPATHSENDNVTSTFAGTVLNLIPRRSLLQKEKSHVNTQMFSQEIILERELGRSEYGVVYSGIASNKLVAIKILSVCGTISEEILNEFKRETLVMEQLSMHCPKLVRLFGVCFEQPYFMVMELLPKGSLHFALHNEKFCLDLQKKKFIAIDVAVGLDFLHKNGIVHRDIKSLNVLLSDDWSAKLSDYGLARLKQYSADCIGDKKEICNLPWKAPELVETNPPTYFFASDIYSYGIVLWEMWSHKMPLEINMIINKPPEPFTTIYHYGQTTPPQICNLIDKCRHVIPQERPTAEKIIEHLYHYDKLSIATELNTDMELDNPDAFQASSSGYQQLMTSSTSTNNVSPIAESIVRLSVSEEASASYLEKHPALLFSSRGSVQQPDLSTEIGPPPTFRRMTESFKNFKV